ncbi:uncharacterized protein LOC126927225 [Bombus affinis]|uniref:uncharacterized protein LOC126927225 n=1 Tax=Bombus affinis TaxID=309941 RepID=UPI0021B70B66|nr:uncharacterized protein LOC126927222 isoform X2 [Bombus affinis]XP_050599463.1 uncharacterized protein LOC126927225 [Bombus affinis]
MRSPNVNVTANYGELQIVIEESTSGEEEEEGRRNESPPRGMDNVRRMSDRRGEGSGHSVVTMEAELPTLFRRRESVACFPFGGVTRILPTRRDPASRMSAPPSGRRNTHYLRLDIMDDIAYLRARELSQALKPSTAYRQRNSREADPIR